MKNWKSLCLVGLTALLIIIMVACGSDSTSGEAGNADSNTGDSSSNGGGDVVYEWKMGSIYSDPSTSTDFNSFGQAQQKFIDLVEEKTNGQVVITPYYNSLLGGSLELFQQVRLGELEVFYGQPMSGADIRFGVWNVPYLFENFEHVERVMSNPEGELFKLAQEWMNDHNLTLLAVGPGVFRGFANSRHRVVTPDDLSDLKVRTYEDPIVSIFWEPIGDPAQLQFSEVHTALETGTVDGLEFQATSIILRQFDEIVKYYTDIDWQWTTGANIIVPTDVWNQLPDHLKELVQEAAWEAMAYQGELEKQDSEKALEQLKQNGVEVYRLSPEERQVWVDYARSLDDKFREAIGEDVFDEVFRIVQSAYH